MRKRAKKRQPKAFDLAFGCQPPLAALLGLGSMVLAWRYRFHRHFAQHSQNRGFGIYTQNWGFGKVSRDGLLVTYTKNRSIGNV